MSDQNISSRDTPAPIEVWSEQHKEGLRRRRLFVVDGKPYMRCETCAYPEGCSMTEVYCGGWDYVFPKLVLALAELQQQIEDELHAPPPLHPPDAEGETYRENQVTVLENVQWWMERAFHKEKL